MPVKDKLLQAQSGISVGASSVNPWGVRTEETMGTWPQDVPMEITGKSTSSGGSASSGQSQSTGISRTIVTPPVLDILDRIMGQRQMQRTNAMAAINLLVGLAPQLAPEGAKTIPGLERGGLGDILAGFAAGGRARGAGVIPESARDPGKVRLPLEALNVPEPAFGQDFKSALAMALQIMQALQIIETGTEQATSGQRATSGQQAESTQWDFVRQLLSDSNLALGNYIDEVGAQTLDPNAFSEYGPISPTPGLQ